MQNQTAPELAEVIDRCEQIALRFVNHSERQIALFELAAHIKFDRTWRLVAHSAAGAKDLWDYLRMEESKGLESMVIAMTGEFYVRSPDIWGVGGDSFFTHLGKSLAWMRNATEVDDETRRFTSAAEAYAATFKINPWLVFLYLLSMSDVVRKIFNMQVPDAGAPGDEQ